MVALTLEGQIGNLEALMRALGSRNDRCVADQRVVDTRVGHKIGLELVQVDVESTVESKGSRDRADNLSDQTVQVVVVRPGDVQVALADIVDSLVVDQKRAVRVLDGAVRGEDGVVGLDHGRGNARCRVDGELELALLAVLGRETFEQQGTETRAGTTTERVENQKALESVAVVNNTPNAVHDILDHLLANGVVPAGVVVSSILLAADQELRMEELAVVTGADLVDGRRVEVNEDGAGHMFPTAGLGEERLERASFNDILSIGVRATITSETMLEEVPDDIVSALEFSARSLASSGVTLTAPRRCCQAGYQPDPGEGEESSSEKSVNDMS